MLSNTVVLNAWKEYLNGNNESFGVVYQHYHKVLTLYCLSKLKALDVAENIASDCLMKLFNQTEPDQIEHLDQWIFTVARNLCNTYWSKNNRRSAILAQVGSLQKEQQQSGALNRLHEQDLEHLLVSILDDDKYKIWKLHEAGYDNEEIADQLNLKAKTVANKKSEARKAIKAAIKKSNGKKE